MPSKNSSPKLSSTSSNATSKNITSGSNSTGDTQNYVSGDSARSSSSHQFHRSASNDSSKNQ